MFYGNYVCIGLSIACIICIALILYRKRKRLLYCIFCLFTLTNTYLISRPLLSISPDFIIKIICYITTNILCLYTISSVFIKYNIQYGPLSLCSISYMTGLIPLLIIELTISLNSMYDTIIMLATAAIIIMYLVFEITLIYDKNNFMFYNDSIYSAVYIYLDFIFIPGNIYKYYKP